MGVRKLKELLGENQEKPVVKTSNPSQNATHNRTNISSKARKREDFANRPQTITIIHILAFLNFLARLSTAGHLHWILTDLHVAHSNYAISGGLLLFSCLIVGGLASPILIFFGTKVSRVTLLASSVLVSGLFMVLLCFTKTFASFIAFYTLLGVGLFLYLPLATNLYIDCSLYEEPTLLPLAASALLGSAFGVGISIIGHKESFWSGMHVWRIVYLFQGILLVIISVVLFKFGRDPRQKKWEMKKIPSLATGKVYEEFIVPFLKNKTYVAVVIANTLNTISVHASSLMVLWFYTLDFTDVWTPLNYAIGVIGAGLGCQLGYTLNTHFSIHPRVRVVLAQVSVVGALGAVYLLFDYFPQSLHFSRNFFPIVTFAGGFCLGFPHAACDWPLLGKVFFAESRKNAFRYYWTFNSFFSSFGPCIVGVLAKLAFGSDSVSNGLRKGLLIGIGLPLVIQLFVYFPVLYTCVNDLKELVVSKKQTKVTTMRYPGRNRVNPLAPEEETRNELLSPRRIDNLLENASLTPANSSPLTLDGTALSPSASSPLGAHDNSILQSNYSEALLSVNNSELEPSFALPHALKQAVEEESTRETDDVIEVDDQSTTPRSPRLPDPSPREPTESEDPKPSETTFDTAVQTSIELFVLTPSPSEDLSAAPRDPPPGTTTPTKSSALPPIRRLPNSTSVSGLRSKSSSLGSTPTAKPGLPPIRRGNSLVSLQSEMTAKANQQKLDSISLPVQPEDLSEHGFKGEVIPAGIILEIQRLIFGKHVAGGAKFSQDWYEGLYFADKGVPYALSQHKPGPNGIVTIIQAFLLKQLVFGKIKNAKGIDPLPEQRQKALVGALREILEQAATRPELAVVIIKKAHYVAFSIQPDNFATFYVHNSHQFSQANGIILFLYSVLLTHGLNNIRSEMDDSGTPMINPFGMATQELINLFLTGRAVSNVFDFDIDGPEGKLHGVPKQSLIGYLTQMEKLNICQVGEFLKVPIHPIWLVWVGDHFAMLFSCHVIYADDDTPVEVHYFDPLAAQNQDLKFEIHFRLETTEGKEGVILDEALEECLRTKWPDAVFVWAEPPVEVNKPIAPQPKKIYRPRKESFW